MVADRISRLGLLLFLLSAALTVFFLPTYGASLSLGQVELKKGKTGEIAVSLDEIPQGFSSLTANLQVKNGDLAKLVDVVPEMISKKFIKINEKRAELISFKIVDIMDKVRDGKSGVLFTVEIEGLKAGETELKLEVQSIKDDEGNLMEAEVEGVGRIKVSPSQKKEEGKEPSQSQQKTEEPEEKKEEEEKEETAAAEGEGEAKGEQEDEGPTEEVQAEPSPKEEAKEPKEKAEPSSKEEVKEPKKKEENEKEEGASSDQEGPPSNEDLPTPFRLSVETDELTLGDEGLVRFEVQGPSGGMQKLILSLTLPSNLKLLKVWGVRPSYFHYRRKKDNRLVYWAADFDDQFVANEERGKEEAELLTVSLVKFQGSGLGEGMIRGEVNCWTDGGEVFRQKVSSQTVQVGPAEVGLSLKPPRDLNGDGFYEDVNGDGSFNREDPVILAFNLDSDAVRLGENIFDFNGDGKLDFLDAKALANSSSFDEETAKE